MLGRGLIGRRWMRARLGLLEVERGRMKLDKMRRGVTAQSMEEIERGQEENGKSEELRIGDGRVGSDRAYQWRILDQGNDDHVLQSACMVDVDEWRLL